MIQKLSLSEKFEIKAYFEIGTKQKEIAKKFSMSQSTVSKFTKKLMKPDKLKEKESWLIFIAL